MKRKTSGKRTNTRASKTQAKPRKGTVAHPQVKRKSRSTSDRDERARRIALATDEKKRKGGGGKPQVADLMDDNEHERQGSGGHSQ